jgi:Flp pilus assembly protein TadG
MILPILPKLQETISGKPVRPRAFETDPHLKLEIVCRLCRRNRQGAAVVEFAVVAPLFFLLVLGMVEFGRGIMVQQIMTNASREGARLAVLDSSTTQEVKTAVTNYLANGSVKGATVTVNPDPPSSAVYGASVTVTVSVPFNGVSWLPSPMFLGGKTLTAKTAMRRETVQ